MIFLINKLERENHMNQAKISELENVANLNRKYLLDEELNKQIMDKENKKLNEELENLGKVSEETLKQLVKENEKNQQIVIKNDISNNEMNMTLLLENYKEKEGKAKDLLEEKNQIAQKIAQVTEEINLLSDKDKEDKYEIVDLENQINEFEILYDDSIALYDVVFNENNQLRSVNEKLDKDISSIKAKLDEIKEKIELNSILQGIDINELKSLSQNNAMVNSSINNLLSKWDEVNSRLSEMQKK